MITSSKDIFIELKKTSAKEKKLLNEFINLSAGLADAKNEERTMISGEINKLKKEIEANAKDYILKIENIKLTRPLNEMPEEKKEIPKEIKTEKKSGIKKEISWLERDILKRSKKEKQEIAFEREIKPRIYVGVANKLFFRYSGKLTKKYEFNELKKNLLKANMQLVPENYISIIILTTIIAFFFSMIISAFFILFEPRLAPPFISFSTNPILIQIIKYLWIVIVVPAVTCLFVYYYPSLEKKSAGNRIDQELPFATIHMAAIAESMLNPKGIFSILIKTGEYKELKKEFTKLVNEINVHGMNLVSALRNSALKSPSTNLTDLFNGLAITINSGGDLKDFFDERAKTLLFEHKIAREKNTKIAETFMDIYISIVIAAPMIFMLLLMIMNISGIGINLTPSMIGLLIIVGVALINFVFLIFIYIKSPPTG